MGAVDNIERLLCERYNVRGLPEGTLAAALSEARSGSVASLKQALDGRELYRWRAAIDAEIAALEVAVVDVPEVEPESETAEEDETGDAVDVEPEPVRRRRGRATEDETPDD